MIEDINEARVRLDEGYGDVRIVQVTGELNTSSIHDIGIKRMNAGTRSLVLDLTRCWFTELSGLTTLLKSVCQLSEDGVSVRLVARDGSFVGQMLASSASYHRLAVYGTLTDARRAASEERNRAPFR